MESPHIFPKTRGGNPRSSTVVASTARSFFRNALMSRHSAIGSLFLGLWNRGSSYPRTGLEERRLLVVRVRRQGIPADVELNEESNRRPAELSLLFQPHET